MGLSVLGTQVLAFGMTWAAGSISGTLAGLVLTAIVLPRVLLLLVGGAVADRAGAFRVLLLGDGVMLVITLALAVALSAAGLSPVLLVGAALAIGIVDAFYLPASGTMPRRLAPGPPSPVRWRPGSSPVSWPRSPVPRSAGCSSRWRAWRQPPSSTPRPSR
jgi:MFS family permease